MINGAISFSDILFNFYEKFNVQSSSVITVLKAVFSIILFIGIYMIFTKALNIPTISEVKNLKSLTKKVVHKNGTFDLIIDKVALVFQKFIRINEYKRRKLVTQFEQMDISITPEEYYSKIAAKTALATIVALLCFFVHAAVGIFALLFVGLFFLMQYNEIDKVVQKKKENIERELPKFVSVIEQTFRNDHDVIKLISTYIENGDTPLTRELSTTLADMKTGDFDTALNRLTDRVDSVFLSETVRGLRSALRGENTSEYFKTLNTKLWDHEKVVIRKKALKTPSKVKYLTKVLLVCMFIIYMVVFISAIWENAAEIFEIL